MLIDYATHSVHISMLFKRVSQVCYINDINGIKWYKMTTEHILGLPPLSTATVAISFHETTNFNRIRFGAHETARKLKKAYEGE